MYLLYLTIPLFLSSSFILLTFPLYSPYHSSLLPHHSFYSSSPLFQFFITFILFYLTFFLILLNHFSYSILSHINLILHIYLAFPPILPSFPHMFLTVSPIHSSTSSYILFHLTIFYSFWVFSCSSSVFLLFFLFPISFLHFFSTILHHITKDSSLSTSTFPHCIHISCSSPSLFPHCIYISCSSPSLSFYSSLTFFLFFLFFIILPLISCFFIFRHSSCRISPAFVISPFLWEWILFPVLYLFFTPRTAYGAMPSQEATHLAMTVLLRCWIRTRDYRNVL